MEKVAAEGVTKFARRLERALVMQGEILTFLGFCKHTHSCKPICRNRNGFSQFPETR